MAAGDSLPEVKTPAPTWELVPEHRLDAWDRQLLQASAPFAQFPFWNEPYRMMKLKPVYAACHHAGVPVAFACILSIGLPRLRIGLIQRGPVNLLSSEPVGIEVLVSLRAWARAQGFAFIRFLGYDSRLLDRVAEASPCERVDSFPLWAGLSTDTLVVDLQESEEAMLSEFQGVAVRNINAARKAGYEIRSSQDPRVLEQAWPIFQELAQRKGISFPRPLSSWVEIIRRGALIDAVTIHTAHLGEKTVQVILAVRDAQTTEYMIGALDLHALEGRPSPACLLHWEAMRYAWRQGCTLYDFGPSGGAVAIFKQKFRPRHLEAPPLATMIVRPFVYRLWSRLVLHALLPMWPYAKRALAMLIGRSAPKKAR